MPLLSLFAMSTFLLTLLGLTVGSSFNCAVRKDISPCTCRTHDPNKGKIYVACERMVSFGQVVEALNEKFAPEREISLKISHSQLQDLGAHSFSELGLGITILKLNHDNLSSLDASVFDGLGRTEYLSLADNVLPEVPQHVLKQMPILKTLDIGRVGLRSLSEKDFQNVPKLQHLVLAGNAISKIERSSIPPMIRHLHLGRNQISDLNGTLRELSELEWIFINSNQLTTLDNELPLGAHKLQLFHAANNRLQKLPLEFRTFLLVESVHFNHNELQGLNGALQKARWMKKLDLSHNRLQELSEDDFLEVDRLEDLQLGFNRLASLNNSLLPMRALKWLNLTHNQLTEFSLQEIRGLKALREVDLSNNQISRLGGRMEQNVVELETRVLELKLEHNLLRSLDGSLMGLHGLERLNLSHNQLEKIAPDDLIGLDQLKVLDISYNHLITLEETSKTFLPSLEYLLASHNALTSLERDFHGLPVLCWADLESNQIQVIGTDLANKTRCRIHGVAGMLHVFLQGNPVLCNDSLNRTRAAMLESHTKLHGAMECESNSVTELVVVEPVEEPETQLPPEALVQLVPKAVTQSVPEAIVQSIPELIVQSVPELVKQSVPEAVTQSTPDVVTQPTSDAVKQPISEIVIHTITEEITQSTTDAVTQSTSDTVTQPNSETVTQLATEATVAESVVLE